MRQSQVEAFRARIMIVASIGLYLPRTGHDHETAWCTIYTAEPGSTTSGNPVHA
jgi:hypothetical protein